MAEYKISNFKYASPNVDDCYKHLSEISYKSPIEVIQHEFQVKLEGDVMKAVKQHDIFVDNEELIKALQYDRDQYTKGFQDGCRERMDELINRVRADTVRKMQKRLTLEFDRLHKKNFMTSEVRQWIIDQTAKEMLEGTK